MPRQRKQIVNADPHDNLMTTPGQLRQIAIDHSLLADMIRWLNGPSAGAARAREILALLKELAKPAKSQKHELLAQKKFERLRSQVSRYSWFPTVSGWTGGRFFVETCARDRDRTPGSYKEAFTVKMILHFAQARKLERLQSCKRCGDWFLTRAGRRQRFCGEVCARKFGKSAEGKEAQRKYMRTYRETSGT